MILQTNNAFSRSLTVEDFARQLRLTNTVQCHESLVDYYDSMMLSLKLNIRQIVILKKQKYYDSVV